MIGRAGDGARVHHGLIGGFRGAAGGVAGPRGGGVHDTGGGGHRRGVSTDIAQRDAGLVLDRFGHGAQGDRRVGDRAVVLLLAIGGDIPSRSRSAGTLRPRAPCRRSHRTGRRRDFDGAVAFGQPAHDPGHAGQAAADHAIEDLVDDQQQDQRAGHGGGGHPGQQAAQRGETGGRGQAAGEYRDDLAVLLVHFRTVTIPACLLIGAGGDAQDDRQAVAIGVIDEPAEGTSGAQDLLIDRVARRFGHGGLRRGGVAFEPLDPVCRGVRHESAHLRAPDAPELAGIVDVAMFEPTVEHGDRHFVLVGHALFHGARNQGVQGEQFALGRGAQGSLELCGLEPADQGDHTRDDGQQARAGDRHEAALKAQAVPPFEQRD